MMERIASFCIDHDVLVPGMYISRVDGDVVTYDIRFKRPNGGDYLSDGAMHTIEHLFATYARNSAVASQVLYVGPMGCRTGFYLLLRDTVSGEAARALVCDAMAFIADYRGHIPGATRIECGNYRSQNLPAARREAAAMLAALRAQGPSLQYPQKKG